MPTEPAISITVSTVQGWAEIRHNVASFEVAAAVAGGEIIVTDGSGGPAPVSSDLAPNTRWIMRPGQSVFQLRELAYRESQAPIVAVTEDHCRVPPDWASKLVAAHTAHPDAVAVGGSVENGATQNAIDWASFLVVQAPSAAPIASGTAGRLSGAVNSSYKRSALEPLDDFDGLGTLDGLHQRSLSRAGGRLVADDSIRVVHDQSLGVRGTLAIHYHAGRTFAGFLRERMDRLAWARCLGVGLVPFARFARVMVVGREKGYGRELARTWPVILALLLVQEAGQVVGFAAGPGDSPAKVQ